MKTIIIKNNQYDLLIKLLKSVSEENILFADCEPEEVLILINDIEETTT